MCGIIGISLSRETCTPLDVASKIITKALKSLEYRGYDSVGIALIEPSSEKIIIKKGEGKLDDVSKKLNFQNTPGCVGIGHTRWATHGAPTDINAHPQVDCHSEVAVVHNGIIKNYLEVKKLLLEKGHAFVSDTDTEVVAHLIEEISKNGNFFESFKRAVLMLEGSYAFAVISSKEPEKVFFAKRESPLIVGIGEKMNLIASDIPAMLDYTNRFIPLLDGEVGWITSNEVHIESINGSAVDIRKRIMVVDWKSDMVRKGGYPHFMIKEIYEQPQVLKSTYDGLMSDNVIERAAKIIAEKEKIFIAAAGTSYHAGLVTKYFIEKFSKKPVYTFISSEYKNVEHLVDRDDILIAISQSGETIDTLKALKAFQQREAHVIAITNVMGSSIGREASFVIPTRAGPEIGVAATKTFLTQILSGTMLAIYLAEAMGKMSRGEVNEYLGILKSSASVVGESISMVEGHVKAMSEKLQSKQSMYFLGRGLGAILSYEAALKMKEISYIHAEAYPAGESKHGPIALIERDFPVFFLVTSDTKDDLPSNVAEMNARGAFTVAVTPKQLSEKLNAKQVLNIPSVPLLLEPYALTPPFQLLAYYTSVKRGYDPDKPRNLAKTVTVE